MQHRSILPLLFFLVPLTGGPGVAQVFAKPADFTAVGANRSWPNLAEGGLALYFAQDWTCGRVLVSRRASLSSAWGTPQVVYDGNPGACGARVSADGLELFTYWGSPRQIHRSVRSSTSVKFPPAKPVTELADKDNRGPGCLSADGLTLYYWQARAWPNGLFGGVAVRPDRSSAFVDQGRICDHPLSWVSADQRVGLTWGLFQVRRPDRASSFDQIRFAGSAPVPAGWSGGAPTYLPETGELIYWAETGAQHKLLGSRRADTLVDYSDWTPGGKVDLDLYGRPVEMWILALAVSQQQVPLPPFGTLRLGSPFLVLGQGAIPTTQLRWSAVEEPHPANFTLALPAATPVGRTVYLQALVVDRVFQVQGSLTNLVSATIK